DQSLVSALSKMANKQYVAYRQEYVKKMFRFEDEAGRLYRKRRGGKQYLDEKPGRLVGDIWNDIYSYQTRTRSKTYLGYPTQKPEKLLERIILASSNEGDIVADFFCGTGTTLEVAKRLRRNWIGVDNNPSAVDLCRKRLNIN
ncbi:MAG: DNA-methyltransferase, partial [Candidatus Thorarchaeota archaeon]